MIKFTIVLRRNRQLSHEEFVDHHKNTHAPLFASLPEVRRHVRRYVQVHSTGDTLKGMPDSAIDGLTELWFDDRAGLEGVFQSANYLKTIRPDEEQFLDLEACEFIVGFESTLIDDRAPLQRFLDESSIRNTIARFADSAARADYDMFRSVWADDAKFVIGKAPHGQSATGGDAIVAMLRRLCATRLREGPVQATTEPTAKGRAAEPVAQSYVFQALS